MNIETLNLFLVLGICHIIADYVAVTPTMLAAKRFGTPIFPIINHAAVHSLLMFICLLFFQSDLQIIRLLTIYQLVTHSIIDILKGRCNVWFPSAANNTSKLHWILFGLDQYLHYIVIVTMVYVNQNI
jgi:hypothetical protein